MKNVALLAFSFVTAAGAVELTQETWDGAVTGKSILVKFFSPTCEHCKELKPAWDELTAEFAGSKDAVIAEVDCKNPAAQSLCSLNGVEKYPTIKYGDPNKMEPYTGEHTLSALKKFAEENLEPMCGPANIDLCDDATKAEIEKYMKMSPSDLEAAIKEKADAQSKIWTDFVKYSEDLRAKYRQTNDKYKAEVTALKASGDVGLMEKVIDHIEEASMESGTWDDTDTEEL